MAETPDDPNDQKDQDEAQGGPSEPSIDETLHQVLGSPQTPTSPTEPVAATASRVKRTASGVMAFQAPHRIAEPLYIKGILDEYIEALINAGTKGVDVVSAVDRERLITAHLQRLNIMMTETGKTHDVVASRGFMDGANENLASASSEVLTDDGLDALYTHIRDAYVAAVDCYALLRENDQAANFKRFVDYSTGEITPEALKSLTRLHNLVSTSYQVFVESIMPGSEKLRILAGDRETLDARNADETPFHLSARLYGRDSRKQLDDLVRSTKKGNTEGASNILATVIENTCFALSEKAGKPFNVAYIQQENGQPQLTKNFPFRMDLILLHLSTISSMLPTLRMMITLLAKIEHKRRANKKPS